MGLGVGNASRRREEDEMSEQAQETILVDAKRAARMLGCSRSMVNALAKRGELPCVRIGRLRKYSPEALRRWVAQNSVQEVG